jgi:hypothetical protein
MDIGLLIRDALGVQRQGWAGDRPALSLEDGPTWTYAELNAYANRCANALTRLGIRPGDRVGALLYNSLEYVGFYFGAARVGAVVVRLNWRLAPAELRFAIEDAGNDPALVRLIKGAVNNVEDTMGFAATITHLTGLQRARLPGRPRVPRGRRGGRRHRRGGANGSVWSARRSRRGGRTTSPRPDDLVSTCVGRNELAQISEALEHMITSRFFPFHATLLCNCATSGPGGA